MHALSELEAGTSQSSGKIESNCAALVMYQTTVSSEVG